MYIYSVLYSSSSEAPGSDLLSCCSHSHTCAHIHIHILREKASLWSNESNVMSKAIAPLALVIVKGLICKENIPKACQEVIVSDPETLPLSFPCMKAPFSLLRGDEKTSWIV